MRLSMPTGLPSLSSIRSMSGSLTSTGLPSRISNFSLHAAAHHLLGRDAVDPFGPGAHELDAAAGDDEGLEAVGAQVGQQLEHRLVDHVGVRACRCPGGCAVAIQSLTVLLNSSVVMPVCVAASISSRPFSPAAATPFMSPFEQRRERLLRLPLRVLRRQCLHAVDQEEGLEVHRLLGPQRAVVVEHRDAFGHRHEVRRAGRRHALDEGDDGLLRPGVVPGGQRFGCRARCRPATTLGTAERRASDSAMAPAPARRSTSAARGCCRSGSLDFAALRHGLPHFLPTWSRALACSCCASTVSL